MDPRYLSSNFALQSSGLGSQTIQRVIGYTPEGQPIVQTITTVNPNIAAFNAGFNAGLSSAIHTAASNHGSSNLGVTGLTPFAGSQAYGISNPHQALHVITPIGPVQVA